MKKQFLLIFAVMGFVSLSASYNDSKSSSSSSEFQPIGNSNKRNRGAFEALLISPVDSASSSSADRVIRPCVRRCNYENTDVQEMVPVSDLEQSINVMNAAIVSSSSSSSSSNNLLQGDGSHVACPYRTNILNKMKARFGNPSNVGSSNGTSSPFLVNNVMHHEWDHEALDALNAGIVRTSGNPFRDVRVTQSTQSTQAEQEALRTRIMQEKAAVEAEKERLLRLAYPEEYGNRYTNRPASADLLT